MRVPLGAVVRLHGMMATINMDYQGLVRGPRASASYQNIDRTQELVSYG